MEERYGVMGWDDSISIFSSLIKCHLIQLSVSFLILDSGNSKDPDREYPMILSKYRRLGMWLGVRAESRKEEMMAEIQAQVFHSQVPS